MQIENENHAITREIDQLIADAKEKQRQEAENEQHELIKGFQIERDIFNETTSNLIKEFEELKNAVSAKESELKEAKAELELFHRTLSSHDQAEESSN